MNLSATFVISNLGQLTAIGYAKLIAGLTDYVLLLRSVDR